MRLQGIARVGQPAPGALLHGQAGHADARPGLGKAARPPVDQGLRPLLAGQGDVQGIQNFLVRRVQRHGGPPEQQAGIRDVFRRARIVALVFTFRNRARPEAAPQQKTHGPLTSVA